MNSLMSKARRPKFEVDLKIIDLNNVPLVSGTSSVKWHLPASASAEHRGRTEKSPIKDHKVSWAYDRLIPVRLAMDRANMLQERLISFEVLQEYNSGARGEKIALGHLSLNLSEYVEMRDGDGEEGVTRRYLMQDSKINSTLKIGIRLRQVDGERNFIAPPLRTAPVFSGISGIIDFEQGEQDDLGYTPSLARSREAGELQDIYRRALAASWGAQPGELPADQCIEELFGGGTGWNPSISSSSTITYNPTSGSGSGLHSPPPTHHSYPVRLVASDDDDFAHHSDGRHGHRHGHRRNLSTGSSRSMATVTGRNFNGMKEGSAGQRRTGSTGSAESGEEGGVKAQRLLEQLQQTGTEEESSSSERGGYGALKRAREVDEFAVREDLKAWKLSGNE